MKIEKTLKLSLDKFINYSLYNKKFGYYMKKDSFGAKGDFITAPNVSRLFSEMIAIWIISFWQSLGSPKNFNLVELGAGNGEMMKIMVESFRNFPGFLQSCNLIIHEKSPSLIKVQKKKLGKFEITWINEIKEINKFPCIFIANEFFDSLAIKQFVKKKNVWFEKFVNFLNNNKAIFIERKFNMKNYEKKINLNISKNQNFIEYSETGVDYLKKLSEIIKTNSGGILIIDYGYSEGKMKNTLQAISKHKHTGVLENICNSDITHNINFKLFQKIIKSYRSLEQNLTTQKKFLIKMGIIERAEIISKNQNFLKKIDIYYRMQRLIDSKQMGNLFKVMLIKNQNNKFKLGF